ncbi:hypothetical protein B2J88_46295 [Rhodococcus sp. SRB_17]|nr:hypothetical protein [Rhodococcus sp. SRB_17]NMM91623.1 hypothetical protein [Rhodococcus sp. SRB_17]
MSENRTPREQFKIDVAAHQAATRTPVLTAADLAAAVEGLTGEKLPTPRTDVAFPPEKAARHPFD